MPQLVLDGQQFIEMMIAAGDLLNNNCELVNSLNIFPVPDGDTGTNMNFTFRAAVVEVQKSAEHSIGKLAEAAARGSLMGARGNSGVILSQLIRGMAQSLEGKSQVSAVELAKALEKGVEVAYKAVMKPVEGTILTVAREAAKAALLASYKENDVTSVIEEAYRKGLIILEKTPDMLPALKQAGVVDAGGKGLLVIYEGFLSVLKNGLKISDLTENFQTPQEFNQDVFGDFIYCTEFLLRGVNLPTEEIKTQLANLGDSLMVVGSDDMLKIHIHSNNPGQVLEVCLKSGLLYEIHINNMQEQAADKAKKDRQVPPQSVPGKPFGVVAVVSGEGLKDIFLSLGTDVTVTGGQTMNPSTEDLLQAVEKVPATKVFLLPNNKNILLAAQQVASLTDKEVKIIPTRTIPQGISAMLSYDANSHFNSNEDKMLQSIDKVLTGEITTAARDSNYREQVIHKGNILGINEGEISVVGSLVDDVTRKLISKMLGKSRELVTLYYGENINKVDAEELLDELTEEFPEIEFEMHFGGQPHYFYILSVE